MATYNVKVGVKEMVAAAIPMPEHWLPLSNLDLLLFPMHVGVFFCYKGCKSIVELNSFSAFVGNLKSALSQTLVTFYPFAGRLVTSSGGEQEVVCNNEGVEFSEAYADINLQDVDFSQPDLSVQGKLVPSDESPALFCVQVTSFKCGGIVVGCSFEHRIADGYSVVMLVKAWSDISLKRLPRVVPTFRRSFLNPQRPYPYPAIIPHLYTKIPSIPFPQSAPPPLASKIYHLQSHHLQNLQSLSATNGKKRSKLEAFSAYLWRLVAKILLNCSNKKYCKLGVVVDGRSRLRKTGLPANYLGNVLSFPYSSARVEDLVALSQPQAADVIHEFVSEGASEEHFRGLVNWVELQRPEAVMPGIYLSGSEEERLVIASDVRFALSEVDFGWGTAEYACSHFSRSDTGCDVTLMESPAGDGSWIVYLHWEKKLMDHMENDGDCVFLPLKWGLLDTKKKASKL